MKKIVKGMTLIEVIISMLVFGIMGVIMVTICVSANSFLTNSIHLNRKTIQEAPYGAAQDAGGLQSLADSHNAAVSDPAEKVEVETTPVTITVTGYGSVSANKYSTKVAAQKDPYYEEGGHMQGNLEFYVMN